MRNPFFHNFKGTDAYAAPEALGDGSEDIHAYPVDIWAIGVCFLHFHSGVYPFDSDDGEDDDILSFMERIQKKVITYPEDLEADVRKLIEGMLIRNPEKRITIRTIKTTEFGMTVKWDDYEV